MLLSSQREQRPQRLTPLPRKIRRQFKSTAPMGFQAQGRLPLPRPHRSLQQMEGMLAGAVVLAGVTVYKRLRLPRVV